MRELKLNKNSYSIVCAELNEIIKTDKSFRITLKEWKGSRSLSQNSLCHKWYCVLSERFMPVNKSFTPAVVKEMLKNNFLGYESVRIFDLKTRSWRQEYRLKHTSKLDVGETKHYMDQIYYWSVDKGIFLPIPEDSEYMKLKQQEVE